MTCVKIVDWPEASDSERKGAGVSPLTYLLLNDDRSSYFADERGGGSDL